MQTNNLNNAILHTRIAFTLFALLCIYCNQSYAEEPHPGNQYKVVRSVYLAAAYFSLDKKQLSRDAARAYLNARQLPPRSWLAFQSEVQVGTVMTIIGPAPKVWHLPFLANRYFVRLDPDVSRGLDVVLELNRGMDGGLDGLSPELFSRLE
jgi:hypothetical protein